MEGDAKTLPFSSDVAISIHALRVEGDEQFPEYEDLALLISIHALRVEGDTCKRYRDYCRQRISIHALRVEGDQRLLPGGIDRQISIHALRVEGDPLPYRFERRICEFLSTPSGWRATPSGGWRIPVRVISIHALRVEGDQYNSLSASPSLYFYPRPPGGGRH